MSEKHCRGCIVTIDAMGWQKDLAKKIIDQEAEYVLALKENQGGLYYAVADLFEYAEKLNFVDCDYQKTVDTGHGRMDIRAPGA